MATTPSRRAHNVMPTPSQTPVRQKLRLDGLYQEGHWWCNCRPRMPAIKRQVLKNTPNRGKPFWTCAAVDGCRFFLWFDDASLRETGLTPCTSRTAPATPLTQQRLTSYGITKRRREEDLLADIGSDEEQLLAEMADRSAQKMKSDVVVITDDEEDASSRPVARTLFPASKRRKTVTFEDSKTVRFEDAEPRKMPFEAVGIKDAPARDPRKGGIAKPAPAAVGKTVYFQGDPAVPSTPPSSNPQDDEDDLTRRVMALLNTSKNIETSLLMSVRQALVSSARKNRSLTQGRRALDDRDLRIAKLEAQVAELEGRERALNSRITNIKASLMRIYEEN